MKICRVCHLPITKTQSWKPITIGFRPEVAHVGCEVKEVEIIYVNKQGRLNK
jgi:hypothetical protein